LHKASSHRVILLVLLLVRSTPTKADTNIYRNGDTRMLLKDTTIKQAKWTDNTKNGKKLRDGGGLYLHVKESGKYWRMAYRYLGKQKTLAIGIYDDVSLAEARKARDDARSLLAQGIDPSQAKQEARATAKAKERDTFEEVARDFHQNKAEGWSKRHADKWLSGMQTYLFPSLGGKPIASITAPMLLDVLRLVEKRGIIETTHTLKQSAGQVFRYGIQTGKCERNPAADLQGALKPIVTKHMAAILEPAKTGEFLRACEGYSGHPVTRVALLLSALLFQRPGNIRQMQWDWVDFDQAMLTIPAEHMKRTVHGKVNGRPHFVPLCRQALALLNEIKPLTGQGVYVFPSTRTQSRPMSDMTLNAAMRRMGFTKEEMTAHGFRAMARTLMIEKLSGIHADVIEAQLAHGKSGPLGMAYDRTEYMEQRRAMMQQWADYLDRLRTGGDVLPFNRVA
jgi:integrase